MDSHLIVHHDGPPTLRDKIAAMTIDGWTPNEIAKALGTTKLVVMHHLECIAAMVNNGDVTPPDFDVTGVPV